jgi:hypothetical protein
MADDAGKIYEPVGVEEIPHNRGDSAKAIHINEKIVNEESYGLRAGSVRYLRIPGAFKSFDEVRAASTNDDRFVRSAPRCARMSIRPRCEAAKIRKAISGVDLQAPSRGSSTSTRSST